MVLWHRTERQACSQQADPRSKQTWSVWMEETDPNKRFRVLHPSTDGPLGIQATEKVYTTKAVVDLVRGLPNGKRTYFLLLVKETEIKGAYQRVGVGIAYWLPSITRFGGLPLHRMADRTSLTLV